MDGLLFDRIEAERRGRAFVVFHDPSGRQHSVSLDASSKITVGRRPDCDVPLAWDNDVSRRHAELLRTVEGWVLVDDESRNGSYLNGKHVRGRHALRDGDVLRFGDTVVLFRAPVPDEGGPAAASAEPGQVTSMGERPTQAPDPSDRDTEQG